ncbi:MAG: T9SS type A sorting domain-containing protein, partial [Candidatus Marinimicrobia bacterium]|nr:T9SS type A sorting domain-containing protein [Candidatus Neomarinimicrobiota bacterium]
PTPTTYILSGVSITDTIALTAYDNLADGTDDQVEGHESWFAYGETSVLGVVDDYSGMPSEFALHANYPNPFNPVTTLRYDLSEQLFVTITIYDILGREVRYLVNRIEEPGFKSVIWNGTNDHGKPVSAGVYIYQIRAHQKEGRQAGEYMQTKKMILLK